MCLIWDSRLYMKVNKDMVNIERVTDKYDVQELKNMIQEHVAYTNSEGRQEDSRQLQGLSPEIQEDHPGGL